VSADTTRLQRFRAAYAEHRASEGRGAGGLAELRALPYLRGGPHAAAWQVRSRTFERFVECVVRPRSARAGRPLRVLDLGAGNGWLCYRLNRMGHFAVALDLRTDDVDGLGAAAGYAELLPNFFPRVAAAFEQLPLRAAGFDVAVFNASLHYATDLGAVVAEAARCVVGGGCVAILDTPWYRRERDGAAMVTEKHTQAAARFGQRASALLEPVAIEYLTPERLHARAASQNLTWRRHRVRYPLWYELRPWKAALQGRRPPSRFDLWEATIP
jgi:SAM-dependent methyltransferase